MLFSLTTFLSSENNSSLIQEKKLCNCFPAEHNLFLNTGILLAARLLGHENYGPLIVFLQYTVLKGKSSLLVCVSFTTQSTLVIVSVSFRALSSESLAINLLMVCPLTNLQTSVSGGVYALHTRHGYGSVAVSVHLWCTHRTQICLSEIQLCSHKTCGAVTHVNIDWSSSNQAAKLIILCAMLTVLVRGPFQGQTHRGDEINIRRRSVGKYY